VNFTSINNIFSVDALSFEECCLQLFRFQYHNNQVYQQWCDKVGCKPGEVKTIEEVPFLPISLFKSHKIVSTAFETEVIFESSGTTQTTNSKHYLKDAALYRESFLRAFKMFYGAPNEYCILALLPSYLERGNSSLVFMVDELIKESKHSHSGFYLHDHEQLAATLTRLEKQGQKTILFGVTYALLDFAEAFPMKLKHTTIIETGGMKGRKKEMTRPEVHAFLQAQLGSAQIHSEYSMTELLSQAYAIKDGRFYCPTWMKVVVRSEDDPLEVQQKGRGVINVIDLANVYSCAFIATDDAGSLYSDGSFEVLGRIDNSDIRGCSLLTL
jgi:phenylacetate-coenzyme A ligase PaaK-like adenylate-forming protein